MGAVRDADRFEDFLAGLEDQLSLLGLELKRGNDQETGVPFLALVSALRADMSTKPEPNRADAGTAGRCAGEHDE